MAWNETYPLSSTIMSSSTEQIRTNWEIINSWWGVQHQTFSNTASGKHKRGTSGVLLVGTTAAIAAVSAPGTGSTAYNTDKGELEIYRSSTIGWQRATYNKFSRLRTEFASAAIPNTAWTAVTASAASPTLDYDGLSEFSAGTVTMKGPGYYWIQGTVTWPKETTNYYKAIGIYVNGSVVAVASKYGKYTRTVRTQTINLLAANDLVTIKVYQNSGASVTIDGAILEITRVS